jgi:hypothetical protein
MDAKCSPEVDGASTNAQADATDFSSHSVSIISELGEPQDFLTVFQAPPLAFVDHEQIPHPVGALDFDYEREMLQKTFRESGAKIAVTFETATTDRLGAFLARGEGRILHFSCHGDPEYLAIEDGWGELQPLEVERLKEWISHDGGQSLQFVFVSACHSRSIGEAFIKAGVPHVVCCRQDSHMIRADAAIEFEKAFYRALACGKLLQEAFDLACQEILACPALAWQDRQEEVQKFCILPRSASHDVPIFFTASMSPRASLFASRPPTPPPVFFPPPPADFLGRDLDIFRIVQALKVGTRLMRVSGPHGIGKSSLVKTCCRYVSSRLHIMNIEDIVWVPFEEERDEDSIFGLFTKLYEGFQDEAPAWAFRQDYTGCIKKLIFDVLRNDELSWYLTQRIF